MHNVHIGHVTVSEHYPVYAFFLYDGRKLFLRIYGDAIRVVAPLQALWGTACLQYWVSVSQ